MNIKKDANKREYAQAEALDMKRCAGSGAFMHKGDIRDHIFLIDSKFTYNNNQITVKRKDIEKVEMEAFDYNPQRKACLLLSINGMERMLISMEDFKEYRNLLTREQIDGR